MRQPIRHFVKICAEHLPIRSPVYEFGSLQVSGKPKEDLRDIFQGFNYIGADLRAGPGVDLTLDLHEIDLPDGIAGTVLCLDTLEHVEYPRRALQEIFRILRPDGIAIISSVFNFPIHNYPNDFWRFTPEGFRSLLKDFSCNHVSSFGRDEMNPGTVVGVGFKEQETAHEQYIEVINKWSVYYSAVAVALHRATYSGEPALAQPEVADDL